LIDWSLRNLKSVGTTRAITAATSNIMKSSFTKNLFFNVAAGLLAFAVLPYLPVSGSELFCGATIAGIAVIALNDYRPRRPLRIKVSLRKPAPVVAVRRRVSALVAA
jgi:hypothetical protein